MPYSGVPSRGCFACRSKKVKAGLSPLTVVTLRLCDEIRPSCQRCLRVGRTCPGYRAESDLVFRDMNSVVESKVQSRIKLRDADDSEGPGAGIQHYHHYRPPIGPLPLDSLPIPKGEWQDLAVARFFADYVCDSDVIRDNTKFLPDLCSNLENPPHLREALHAVAFASQANQERLEWLEVEGIKAYGRLLAMVPKLLQDPGLAARESTLVTIYLLGLHEIITGYKPLGTLFGNHHDRGLLPLLRLRDRHRFSSSSKERSLIRVICSILTIKCTIRHTTPADEAPSWLEFFGSAEEHNRLRKAQLQTAFLCAEAQRLIDSSTQDEKWRADLLRVISEAIAIDQEYQRWSESASGPWLYHTCQPSDFQSGIDGQKLLCYHDIWVAFIWNNYRGSRAHLHEVLLHCISLYSTQTRPLHPPSALELPFNVQTTLHSASLISSLVSDILASVAFCLGDIDSTGNPVPPTAKRLPLGGYLLLWPLHVARTSTRDAEIEAWVRARLGYVSDVLGVRNARLVALRERKGAWDLR